MACDNLDEMNISSSFAPSSSINCTICRFSETDRHLRTRRSPTTSRVCTIGAMLSPNACSRQRGSPFKAVRLPLKSDRLPFSQSVELDDQIADSALGDQLSWRMSSKCLKWGRQPFFLRRGDDVIIHPR
jgi:hypothetical protein